MRVAGLSKATPVARGGRRVTLSGKPLPATCLRSGDDTASRRCADMTGWSAASPGPLPQQAVVADAVQALAARGVDYCVAAHVGLAVDQEACASPG
jgi:hypothetical protein